MIKKHSVIIGGGIGGLATSILLAKAGHTVSLYEKLPDLGGRARQFKAKGFTFDMGPSWYLMPGVFEHFYKLIGEDISKHISLTKLTPGYKVFFEKYKEITIHGNLKKDMRTFEAIEKGAGEKLKQYVGRAGKTYAMSVESFLYTNFDTVKPFFDTRILRNGPFMLKSALQSIDSYVSEFFSDQRLKQIMEYPTVFLGASPYNAPAIFHLMSYMDFEEGVYYPDTGLYRVIESLISIAEKNGVSLHTNAPVGAITSKDGVVTGVTLSSGKEISADIVISNADLHFTETSLLSPAQQTYKQSYWDKRQNGPSALLMYLGVRGALPQLEHHNLFFVDEWKQNFDKIFVEKTWPDKASLYICKPSATDKSVAPKGHENLFVLVPLPSKNVTESELNRLSTRYLDQVKHLLNEPDLDRRIVYKKVFSPNDFENQYNAWQGSALGLSHTLRQTAVFRPQNKSKKVSGLYYVGGNTTPGIGLPMCLIGAELVYKRIHGIKTANPLKSIGS